VKNEGTRQYYSRSYSIRKDQYDDLMELAVYNKITGKGPKEACEIVRDAIDMYLSSLGEDKYWRVVG